MREMWVSCWACGSRMMFRMIGSARWEGDISFRCRKCGTWVNMSHATSPPSGPLGVIVRLETRSDEIRNLLAVLRATLVDADVPEERGEGE